MALVAYPLLFWRCAFMVVGPPHPREIHRRTLQTRRSLHTPPIAWAAAVRLAVADFGGTLVGLPAALTGLRVEEGAVNWLLSVPAGLLVVVAFCLCIQRMRGAPNPGCGDCHSTPCRCDCAPFWRAVSGRVWLLLLVAACLGSCREQLSACGHVSNLVNEPLAPVGVVMASAVQVAALAVGGLLVSRRGGGTRAESFSFCVRLLLCLACAACVLWTMSVLPFTGPCDAARTWFGLAADSLVHGCLLISELPLLLALTASVDASHLPVVLSLVATAWLGGNWVVGPLVATGAGDASILPIFLMGIPLFLSMISLQVLFRVASRDELQTRIGLAKAGGGRGGRIFSSDDVVNPFPSRDGLKVGLERV